MAGETAAEMLVMMRRPIGDWDRTKIKAFRWPSEVIQERVDRYIHNREEVEKVELELEELLK